jgi:hypothetical protein
MDLWVGFEEGSCMPVGIVVVVFVFGWERRMLAEVIVGWEKDRKVVLEMRSAFWAGVCLN